MDRGLPSKSKGACPFRAPEWFLGEVTPVGLAAIVPILAATLQAAAIACGSPAAQHHKA